MPKSKEQIHRRGFTLVELLVVMGIMSALYLLVTGTLFRSQQRASLSTITASVVQDVREQQIHAMMGDTSTLGNATDFSVHFEQNQYIFYPGTAYNSSNPANTIIPIPAPFIFSAITLPNQTLTFSHISGDVRNFVSGQDTFTLQNTQAGDSQKFRVNSRGVVFLVP